MALLSEKPWHLPFQQHLPPLARLNLLAAAPGKARRFLRALCPQDVAELIAKLTVAHQIVPCLWQVVGVRLLMEMLLGLRAGKQFRLGDTLISDRGLTLANRRLFGADDSRIFLWTDVDLSNQDGELTIRGVRDSRYMTSLSYLEHDNVHILEHALRMLINRRVILLSELLQEGTS